MVAMFVIAGINSNRVERENAAAAVASAAIEAAKTPEQKEAEAKIKREAENRMNKVSVAVIAVHNVMRDPESLRWSLVLANADASVICLEYRARNGFGGMNVENLVFVKDMPYKSVTKWNKHCTSDSLFDMKSVTLSIAKS